MQLQSKRDAVYSLCILVLCSFIVNPTFAQTSPIPTPQPGEYIAEGGWGTLTLTAKGKTLSFEISAVGANGHTCSLDGDVRNGRATLEGEKTDEPCIVTFTTTGKGINVKAGDNGACRTYCGVRAGFEGMYLKPSPQCTGNAINKSRSAFKRLYDAKQFVEARRTLEVVFNDCGNLLHWLTMGRIRNDLAVTFHKLGDLAACRAILAPLAEDAKTSNEDLRDKYPPTDAESYLPIVLSTRTNLKLCRGKS